jgi:hypothetical protein
MPTDLPKPPNLRPIKSTVLTLEGLLKRLEQRDAASKDAVRLAPKFAGELRELDKLTNSYGRAALYANQLGRGRGAALPRKRSPPSSRYSALCITALPSGDISKNCRPELA